MYELQIPESQICIRPGNIVKLHKFDDEQWIVNLGWFSYAGNRPMNGWYLVSTSNKDKVKPLNMPDLDDIYVVEIGEVKEDYKELDPKIKKLIHDLKLQVEELTKEVNQLVKEVEAKDEVIAQKGQEILELQRQIRELQSQIEELESQHRLDADTIATLNAQVTAQAQIIAEKAAEIRELTAKVAELAEENELLTQQHQEDLATIQQQASTIQEQAQSIADLTAENETLTDENDRLTDENESLVVQHQQDTATIQSQGETITQQSEQITELNGEVTELTTENTRLENLTETQRETIQYMVDNPPIPQLDTPDPVTPSTIQQTIRPESPAVGLTAVVVNGIDPIQLGFDPQYYEVGHSFLGIAGTNNTDLQVFLSHDDTVEPFDIECSASKINPYLFYQQRRMRRCVLTGNPTEIGTYAFYQCTSLESMSIPNSVTQIGQYAFQDCSSMRELTLSTGLTETPKGAFAYCRAVVDLVIPSNVKKIGYESFTDLSSLVNLTLENGIEIIDYAAFARCAAKELIIPDTVTTLAQYAFREGKFEYIYLPNSITSMQNNTFYMTTTIKNVELQNGFNANNLYVNNSSGITHDSILGMFNALADRTGLTAYTLGLGATNLNKMTAEEKAIATNKNWNLA